MFRTAEREQVPVGFDPAEAEHVPLGVMSQCLKESRIERDCATFTGFCLAPADSEKFFFQVDLVPTQVPNLTVPHPGVERQHEGWVDRRRARFARCFDQLLLFIRSSRRNRNINNMKTGMCPILSLHPPHSQPITGGPNIGEAQDLRATAPVLDPTR